MPTCVVQLGGVLLAGFSFKKIFLDAIDGETIGDYLNKLDYTLVTPEERIELVNNLLGDNNFFVKYFERYYDPHLTQNDYLSEDNNVSMALEIISNYICMEEKSTKKQNKEIANGVTINETPSTDNYYKSNSTVLYGKDFTDPELSPLVDYDHLKSALCKMRGSPNISKKKLDRLIGEVNKDMLLCKSEIKRPICFLSCSHEVEPIHWIECDYYNIKHIKAMLQVPPRGLHTDLGVLTYDLDEMIASANLTENERKIIKYIRTNEVSQEDAAKHFKCNRSNINQIIKNAAKKIVEHNLSHVLINN